jgi:predicted transglutaminase-like cysteine proteinase
MLAAVGLIEERPLMRLMLLAALPGAFLANLSIASPAGAQSVLAPPAFYVFCARNPGECRTSGPLVDAMEMTPERWAELDAVNRHVNSSVERTTDMDVYGKPDVWAIPTNGRGDCEDIALEKRRELISQGWPSSVLLMSVARDHQGEGHTVLTVVTSDGDLSLDSRKSQISKVIETGYYFYSRQSQSNPRDWVALAPNGSRTAPPPTLVSDLRSP